MKCSTVRDLLSAYLDDELEGTDREAVREHLECCPDCSLYYEELKQLDADLHSVIYEETDPSDRFTRELLERAEQDISGSSDHEDRFSFVSRSAGTMGAVLTLMVGLFIGAYLGMGFLDYVTSQSADRVATEQSQPEAVPAGESFSSAPDGMDSPPASPEFVTFRDSYFEVSAIEAAQTP